MKITHYLKDNGLVDVLAGCFNEEQGSWLLRGLSREQAHKLGQYLVDIGHAPQPSVDHAEGIDALKSITDDHVCEISAIKGIIESQAGQIADLKVDVNALTNALGMLQARVANKIDIQELKQRLEKLEKTEKAKDQIQQMRDISPGFDRFCRENVIIL